MKKLLLILMTAVLLVLAACGSGDAADAESTPAPTATPVPTPMVLDVCVGTEAYTMDPTYINDVQAPDYIGHLFEGLTKYAPVATDRGDAVVEMALVLGMAERCDMSGDGLTYTFTLRSDAVWSDGQPVTAQDFVYAWQRLFTPSEADEMKHSASAEQLFGVLKNATEVSSGKLAPSSLGVVAKSDKVLEVYLEQPCSHFLKLCASICLLPLRQDVIEAYGGDWTREGNIVVNGAYTLESLVHDDCMTLQKNPLYYDGDALGPDTIIWHFSDSSASTLTEYNNGAYDFISDVTDTAAAGYGSSPRAGTYYLYLNVNNIQDWRVRAAMTLAIDRESITQTIGEGTTPAVGMIPAGIADSAGVEYIPAEDAAQQPLYAWLQQTYPKYDLNTYDGRCELAKKLYNEALTVGSWYRSYKVYYRFNESTVNRAVAETCQANWKDVLGLTAEFSLIDADKYADSLASGSFDIAYLGWLPDYNDPQNFLDIMRRGGEYNHSEWGDGSYTDQVDAILSVYDAETRDQLQLKADGALFTQWRFAVCPIYSYGDTYCAAEGVTNVGHSSSGYYSFHYAQKQ